MAIKEYVSVGNQVVYETDYTNPSGDILTYGRDALGSVVAGYDAATSAVFTVQYKPYGEVITNTGSISSQRFLWAGSWGYRYTAGSAVSQYIRARHLSSRMGVWNTVDPLWPNEMPYRYGDGKPNSSVDPTGLKPDQDNDVRNKIGKCRKLKPKQACFTCLYEVLHGGRLRYSPQRACKEANKQCGTHFTCGPCGPGGKGFPKVPECDEYNEDFVDFLHGKSGKDACGGFQGFDKLAHCMDNCMWTQCYFPIPVGVVICIAGQILMNEDDPEDIDANELGRGIGLTASTGRECFERCAAAVDALEAW